MWETLQTNYNNQIYQFQIIKFNQLSLKFEFQILLQGLTMTICKSQATDWELKNNSTVIAPELVKMIGCTIANKYRLSFSDCEQPIANPQKQTPAVN